MRQSINKEVREEGRCECGSLLFRRVKGGIEIKCRRCKKVALVEV